MSTEKKWTGTHRGTKAGKAGPKEDVMHNANRKLVARLKGRQDAHAAGLRDAANKHHGHQVPGSMKKVY